MSYGIDVSHHQAPASLPWAKLGQTSTFCIVRSSYGTMRDRVTNDHLRRAREVGLKVGCYHFYRPSQPARDQLATFQAQLAAGNIAEGDIVPALDIEADPFPKPGVHVSPAWQDGVRFMLDALCSEYGDAMVYITQREFVMLGSPAWLLDRPLWVAHYTAAAKPATPGGRPWTLWQHRVGPYDPNGPGGYVKERPELDQNRLSGVLPLIDAATRAPLPRPDPAQGDDGLEELLASNQGDAWQRLQDAVDASRSEGLDQLRETPATGTNEASGTPNA